MTPLSNDGAPVHQPDLDGRAASTVAGMGALTFDRSRCPRSVQAERVRTLYHNAPTGLVVNLLLGSLMTWVLWDLAPQGRLLAWFLALLAITLLRGIHLIAFFRRAPDDVAMSRWRLAFLLGSLLSGIVWGGLGWFFVSSDHPQSQIWITFALGGMVAGATAVLGSVYRVFISYCSGRTWMRTSGAWPRMCSRPARGCWW